MDSFGASRGRRKKRLGDLLIEGGLINDEQLQQAVEFDEGSLGGLSYRRQCAHIG